MSFRSPHFNESLHNSTNFAWHFLSAALMYGRDNTSPVVWVVGWILRKAMSVAYGILSFYRGRGYPVRMESE